MNTNMMPEIVKANLGMALAQRCMADNRYPQEVAREWLVLNPYGGTYLGLRELIDLIDTCITEIEGED